MKYFFEKKDGTQAPFTLTGSYAHMSEPMEARTEALTQELYELRQECRWAMDSVDKLKKRGLSVQEMLGGSNPQNRDEIMGIMHCIGVIEMLIEETWKRAAVRGKDSGVWPHPAQREFCSVYEVEKEWREQNMGTCYTPEQYADMDRDILRNPFSKDPEASAFMRSGEWFPWVRPNKTNKK